MFDLRTLRAADATLAALIADPAAFPVQPPRRLEALKPAPAHGCPRHAAREEVAA